MPDKRKSERKAEAVRANARKPRRSRAVSLALEKLVKNAGGEHAVKSAVEAMRTSFEFVSELSRQILFDDLRDPKTGRPMYERIVLGGSGRVVRVRAHVSLDLRHREMESLRDRLGMPRTSVNAIAVADAPTIQPFAIQLVGFPKPGPGPGTSSGIETPAPEARTNGQHHGNGVAH